MKAEHQNPFDALAELELNCGPKQDLFSDTDIFAELRIDEDEIEIEGFFVTIGVSRALLALDVWGCEVLPGSRLNDRSKASVHSKLVDSRTKNANRALTAGGKATPSSGSVNMGGSISAQSSDGRNVQHTHEWATNFVVCRPGKRWQIHDPVDVDRSGVLSGTFVANERLCAVSSRPDANLVEIQGSLSVRRRDFVTSPEGNMVARELRKRTHQDKFIKAILAKSIVENSNQSASENQTGRIILAKSSLSGEDDDAT